MLKAPKLGEKQMNVTTPMHDNRIHVLPMQLGRRWRQWQQGSAWARQQPTAPPASPLPAIGVLDSGVGGLTVVKEILRLLPQEPVIYIGDNARCPYGPRSADEVRMFTRQLVRRLQHTPLRALVLACNTATAAALEELRQALPYPVLGVIEPGARSAVRQSHNGRVGVIATAGTIHSGAHRRSIMQLAPGFEVFGVACPELVTLVESQNLHGPEAEAIIAQALAPLRDSDIDTLILGCTHFPILASAIQTVVGPGVQLVNPAEETVRELSMLLPSPELSGALKPALPQHQFLTTGERQPFQHLGEELLNTALQVETCTLPPAPALSVLRREALHGMTARGSVDPKSVVSGRGVGPRFIQPPRFKVTGLRLHP